MADLIEFCRVTFSEELAEKRHRLRRLLLVVERDIAGPLDHPAEIDFNAVPLDESKSLPVHSKFVFKYYPELVAFIVSQLIHDHGCIPKEFVRVCL